MIAFLLAYMSLIIAKGISTPCFGAPRKVRACWHTWERRVSRICSRMGQNVAVPVRSSSVRSCESEAASESYFPWAVALHKWGVCHQTLPDGARSFLHVQPAPCADTEGSRMTIMFPSDPNSPHFSTHSWKEIMSLRGWLINLVPLAQLSERVA